MIKEYKPTITLNRNQRGCYILDTVKGCGVCQSDKPNGCYDNCYAKNIASRYGFNFSKPVNRDFYKDTNQLYLFDFSDYRHIDNIIKQIKNIEMPFVRIGEMGDPSENWEHTINTCKTISYAKKPIVIITKHWKTIPDYLLSAISKMDICINTSISALDNDYEIDHRLKQYNKLKKYCNSVLRIVSCDFNTKNYEGCIRSDIQDKLFNNKNVIDTIFRPNLNNQLVKNKVIKIKKVKFLKSNVWASVFNKKSYFGDCANCPDMCGIRK
jgi:hypothetical protein